MTEIRRYDIETDGDDSLVLLPWKFGSWVKWEDVQDLLARVGQLEELARDLVADRKTHGASVMSRQLHDRVEATLKAQL